VVGGGGDRFGSCCADCDGGSVAERCWGVEPDAGVAVDVVVVIEELGAEHACVGYRSDAARECGPELWAG
jgi:hypothetical protein